MTTDEVLGGVVLAAGAAAWFGGGVAPPAGEGRLGGIVLAAGAAACFDGAVALQAVEARAVGERTVGAGLLRSLIARPRWLAATALGVAGWPLQVAALSLAPLTV